MQVCLHAWSRGTLCDPSDYSPPGSSVCGIFQARILEWVAIFSFGDLPNPGIKPMSPDCRQILYPLRHQGSPKFTVLIILKCTIQWFLTLKIHSGFQH